MWSWPGRAFHHVRIAAAAYAVLLLSLVLTGLAWYYVRTTVQEQNNVRFEESVQATKAAVDRRTDAYLDALFGARGVFLASNAVEREEWESYVKGIETKSRLEGLQALGFARYVSPDDRKKFERESDEQGRPRMRPDLDPGGERSAYFPLTLVAPLDRANTNLIDHDYYTDPAHRVAMNKARDSGSPQATRMVYVLTEPPAGSTADLAYGPGFAVYLPVYDEAMPDGTRAERRKALKGFIVGYFRRDGLFDDVFGRGFDPAIDFEVYDGADVGSSTLLYDDDGVQHADDKDYDPLFSSQERSEVAGRRWSLYFATTGFKKGAESNLPAFVLASGIGLSLLLFGVSWMLVRSRILAEDASKDLEDANRELEGANRELEAFSYSVSHDLRAPLRTIDGFSQILQEDYEAVLDEEGLDYLGRVRAASAHMAMLIDDLLDLSRVSRRPLRREPVDLAGLATEIVEALRAAEPERNVDFMTGAGIRAYGDMSLLKVALENLLGNAWKFTEREEAARIEFGVDRGPQPGGVLGPVYFVRDNGAGFDQAYSDKLFGAFQRLHGQDEFEGTGIGLATVARIIHRHGGQVWAEGEAGEGATFYFTLGGRDHGDRAAAAKKAELA